MTLARPDVHNAFDASLIAELAATFGALAHEDSTKLRAVVIAGEGPALAHLNRLARELGIQDAVRFIGYLDRRTELPDCYAAGDAFVFASRTETQGLVLLEAMAQGTPVVSTAELGTRSILTPDCGAFVVPEQEDAFAAAVMQALKLAPHAARRAKLRAHAESWASLAMARRLVSFYKVRTGSHRDPVSSGAQLLGTVAPDDLR